MKFGANTLIWSGSFGPAEFDLLPRIRDAGFDGVEIPIFHPETFDAQAARRAIAAAGLECTACSAFMRGSSLVDEDAAVRRESISRLKAILEAAAEAGAGIIAGPMYSPVGHLPGRRRTQEEWKRAVEGLRECAGILPGLGLTLAIEPLNRFETFFLNTAADAARLCDEVGHPQVGILFDTFHANIEEKHVGDAIAACGSHLKHVHTCENDRGTPGKGHVPWPEVFSGLRAMQYDGWLTIESFGFNIADIAAAAAIWRDIERTPEEIAFEGVKFLRRNAG